MKRGEEKKNKKSKVISLILMIAFLLIAMAGAVFLMFQKRQRDASTDYYSDMIASVNAVTVTENSDEAAGSESENTAEPADPILALYGAEIPPKNLVWEDLQAVNPDIYAWICVPDTIIDYPVLQHPTSNEYYLNHNLDGTEGYPACVYTENYNSKDFNDRNTVLYAHNLKDGTMFSSLHNFETIDLTNENHFFYIYTGDTVNVYLVVAAYEFPAKHLLLSYDLSNIYVYEQYLKDMFKLTNAETRGVYNIRLETELNMSDKIVTLSTCVSDHNADYRYLVTGQYLTTVNF